MPIMQAAMKRHPMMIHSMAIGSLWLIVSIFERIQFSKDDFWNASSIAEFIALGTPFHTICHVSQGVSLSQLNRGPGVLRARFPARCEVRVPIPKRFVAAAFVVFLSHISVLGMMGTRWPGPLLSSLVELTASILAAAACIYAFLRSVEFARRFWALFSLYFVMRSIAQVGFILDIYVLHRNMAPVSAADLLFFLAGAPAAMVLFLEPRPRSKLSDLQWWLDCLQVTLVVATGYFYFLYPAYVPSIPFGVDLARQRVEEGFIFRYALLTAGFLLRTYFASDSLQLRLYSIGSIYFVACSGLLAITDYELWVDRTAPGTWTDLTWTIPAALLVISAATWREGPEVRRRTVPYARYQEVFRFFAPSIPVFLIVLMSIHMPGRHSQIVTSALVVSFLIFAVRLGLAQHAQRLSEQALRNSVSLLEATLASTADGILVVDRMGKIVSFNQRFVELWQIPESLVESKDDAKILSVVKNQLIDPQAFLVCVNELYSRPGEEDYQVLHFKDRRVFERYSKPQYVDGDVVGRVWSFRDISQRWFLEAQLRHSQKMEAVGRLAGGIAHDFNNVLTIMTGYLQLSLNRNHLEPEVASDLSEVQKAVDHASSLTKQLLAFSRQPVIRPQALDLNEGINGLLQILGRVISEDIELTTSLEPGLAPVLIDKTQLEQVIMNLVVNARDAMPKGGKLRFETYSRRLDSEYPQTHPNALAGNFSVLSIQDTGGGIAPETIPYIFEPFFTTKDPGKGTGLGLSTVYGIVKQAGGFIEVNSEAGQGTKVCIYFPQAERAVLPFKTKQFGIEDMSGNETILIVEDNRELRQLTAKILRSNGYTVLEANAGAEAENICRDYPKTIDLVLSDVVMPGLRGPEVLKRLLAMRPNLRAIFMSGFTDDEAVADSVSLERIEFMQKPFGPAALLAKVRSVLNSAGGDSKKIPA
jgi:two-component system cell cycle sensor histidine kinase/response regulator CckA